MTEERWDLKKVHEYTLDDALECWCDFECSSVADAMLDNFKQELATLRATKAEAVALLREVNRYVGNHCTSDRRHVLPPSVRDAIEQFLKEHSDCGEQRVVKCDFEHRDDPRLLALKSRKKV